MISLVRGEGWQLVGCILAVVMLLAGASFVDPVPAHAAPPITPPDLGACNGVDACEAPNTVCSSGFKITLVKVDPANFTDTGTATYHYRICDAHLSECPFLGFHALSHLDLTFPKLGGSCLTTATQISGQCVAVDNTPTDGHTASVGSFGLGDASCFAKTCGGAQGPTATSCTNDAGCVGNADGSTCITGGSNFVAKCESTDIAPGDCVDMDITIAGELTGLGVGATVVVDKEATTCTASCLAGPSCDKCGGGGDEGEPCLTRTRGFWGTHPRIAAIYDPVTVCGKVIDGAVPGTCSTSEALCTSANDYKKNPAYLTLVAQLTAAKLNLNATAALSPGASCSTFSIGGNSIQQIIAACEANFCDASNQAISTSGCIEMLDAFNNSQDVGFDQTPAPFDTPGPAEPAQCQAARGNGKAIGVNLCN